MILPNARCNDEDHARMIKRALRESQIRFRKRLVLAARRVHIYRNFLRSVQLKCAMESDNCISLFPCKLHPFHISRVDPQSNSTHLTSVTQ